MMMGENFICYFNKITVTKNNYYVETLDGRNIERLKEATNINEIYSVDMNSLFKEGLNKYDYMFSFLKLKKVISDFANDIDLVIILGGDDFTEDYGWQGPIINAIKFNLLKRVGLKIVMLGQTMGPYRSFRKQIMKQLLMKIDKIYPRDPLSYNYLKGLGLKNIELTDDLALLPLSKQQYKERTKEYITYCPSELIYRYSKEGKRQEWIMFNQFIIEKIMEKYPDKKLVLLAHVLKPKHVDDRIITNELYGMVKEKYKARIVVENKVLYPYEVRNYIQQSFFTISSRMHPIISSVQSEIPTIAFSYSDKYWGIIEESYGLSEYIIDVRYLSYDEMKEKLIELVDKIEVEYEETQQKMSNRNKIANENVVKALKGIENLMK